MKIIADAESYRAERDNPKTRGATPNRPPLHITCIFPVSNGELFTQWASFRPNVEPFRFMRWSSQKSYLHNIIGCTWTGISTEDQRTQLHSKQLLLPERMGLVFIHMHGITLMYWNGFHFDHTGVISKPRAKKLISALI